MINYFLKKYVIIIIIFQLFLKNKEAIKIKRFHDYLNFIKPTFFTNISKYKIKTNFNVLRKKDKYNSLKVNGLVESERESNGEGKEDTYGNESLEEKNINKINSINEIINNKDDNLKNVRNNDEKKEFLDNRINNNNESIDNKHNVYLNGEILKEEEINEHMRFQQWSDRFLLSNEENFFYDIENKCINTKYYDKINQINDKFYKKKCVLKDSSISLIPFHNKGENKNVCRSMTKNIKEKLSYDLFEKKNSNNDNINKVNNNSHNDSTSTQNYVDHKSISDQSEVILNEEEIRKLSHLDFTKRTNIIIPSRSLYNSVYIGKEAFSDFIEKGLNSIKLSLNKYLNNYYECNLKYNLDDKIFLMYILRYAKNYILNIIYKTFQVKLLNEVEIENDSNILPDKNKLINNETYLDLSSEYEEIINILIHFFEKINDLFKINEKELIDYLAKKRETINYSTPYQFKNNKEAERHINNMWNFFNFKIFNNELPNFDFVDFYWINSDVENLLKIKNMKTYKIVNKEFINLPSILILSNLKDSPLLLNYTILKMMYEYKNLLKNDILQFKEVKNYGKFKKFDEMKQKIIKFVHGVSGLLENIDFYFYTPYLGDLNLSSKESLIFFSYLKNINGDNNRLFYNLEYNNELSFNNRNERESSNKTNYFGKDENDSNIFKKEELEQEEITDEKNKIDTTKLEELEEEVEEEDDLVFLLLKSKTTNDINKAIHMATNVYKKKNINNIWGNSYINYNMNESIDNENVKEGKKKIYDSSKKENNFQLQRFRIPLNEFSSSLFLCDVNNSMKYLTQGIEKLKELNEFDLTYVHNALTYSCLRFLHDSGNENEDVDSMLKKFQKNEKVETTNNIMTLQMMVVIGELFRNIRKMRNKEKFFFKRILQTDVITDLYNNHSIYDENMDINNMDYVVKNLKIDYPLKSNILLNEKNKEEIAYYFLNYYTKYLFRFDLPNNIVIKFTNDISGLSFYDYNYDYISNDSVIYINNDISNSLILSRVLLDECLNIYEKYTTYIHKYGGNTDNSTIKEAKSKLKKEGEEENIGKDMIKNDTLNNNKLNNEKYETEEEISEDYDGTDDDSVNAEDYEEENINEENVSLNNIKEIKSEKSDNYEKCEEKIEEKKSEEVIDDENVDIFNYLKINRIMQFIRFIIEYNNWPIFLDDIINLENYLNSTEINLLKNLKHYNNLNNFYLNLKSVNISKNRIMQIIENSIKRENCENIWLEKKIPIKHIASALFTNNYVNLYKVFQKGIKVLINLNMNEVNFIMNKCKYAAEIVYYKRLEEIKSSTNNLIFTMYNENLSSIEYYFDKLKEKIILIKLVKNQDVFQILANLISGFLPNSTKNPKEIDVKEGLKKENINKLIFLYDEEKKRCGTANVLNRKNVTYNLFHFFNKEIFDNKINNIEIEFVKDDKLLSSHKNFINTFENSKILINDNVFSINILSNVLLKEMAEIFYFYNENEIEKENKLYLNNTFKSLYLPSIFKYSKSFQNIENKEFFDFKEKNIQSNSQKYKNNENIDEVELKENEINEGKNKKEENKNSAYINKNFQKEHFAAEKDKYDIEKLIDRIAYYDHDEMFKEILEFRKFKYNDNIEIQKCLEEYLFTYDKISMIKYCSPDANKDKINKENEIENKSSEKELCFEPSDIKMIYLNYMYKYIEYIINKKELPINFNYINDEWINCLTDLENQKILDYSTKKYTGHLYDLLINSNACSSKRALDILEVSLRKNENEDIRETTVSSSDINNSIKNFNEFILWISNNKKKTFEKLNEEDVLNTDTPDNIKKEIKDIVQGYNAINETNTLKDIDPNNVTISDLKDLVKKHNISKDEVQAALSQLDIPNDFDINSLF
ncbi:conserved Plasmodium protein, unknown function [Plasmodium gallinaceum]|uniref:Uncharacterized protein n=1 Tax=Plasmodium gallinaceum TaxID=5849 RepID=A0A1J1GKS9_PLAGA|nr:conserved Plasmodium protein, unknown function [Plasmodium gallinaceum]CRG92977.1 conserved Plasmodium protein, unknown function [Plasmodium gallinaceum]